MTELHDHFDFNSLTRTNQRLIELTTETIIYWQSWFIVILLTYILALQYWILYQIYQSPYSVDPILSFIDQHLCESLHMIVIMTIWKKKKLQIRQNLWIIRLIESRIDQEVISLISQYITNRIDMCFSSTNHNDDHVVTLQNKIYLDDKYSSARKRESVIDMCSTGRFSFSRIHANRKIYS